MAGYTYDPSESIKQGFQQATASIGGIFNQVIQQQHRDYTLAENTFQNIEALKKDLNIFGQKNVTQKSNDLLKEAGAAILSSGKLDYSKLGEIRQKVSDIKDLKQGYELGAKEYERMLQLGIANKDNLVSFEKYYKDLSAIMGDENLVKNPQDLQRVMASTYSKNLDATAMFGKTFLKQNPLVPVSVDIRNKKGQVVGVAKGEIPSNMKVGEDGKLIPPPPITVTDENGNPKVLDYIDQEILKTQQNNPDLWNIMKSQTGFGGTIASDRAIMQDYLSRIPYKLSTHEVKSENQLRKEEADLKISEAEAKYKPAEIISRINQVNASARASNLSSKKTQMEIDALTANATKEQRINVFPTEFNIKTKDVSGKPINKTVLATGTDLGKPIQMTVPTISGDKLLNVTQITHDKDGVTRVAYLEQPPKGAPINIFASTELNADGSAVPAGTKVKYITINNKYKDKFLSTAEENIRRDIKDKDAAEKKWNDVQSLYKYGNVDLDGTTYNLDKIAKTYDLKSKQETLDFLNQQLNK